MCQPPLRLSLSLSLLVAELNRPVRTRQVDAREEKGSGLFQMALSLSLSLSLLVAELNRPVRTRQVDAREEKGSGLFQMEPRLAVVLGKGPRPAPCPAC